MGNPGDVSAVVPWTGSYSAGSPIKKMRAGGDLFPPFSRTAPRQANSLIEHDAQHQHLLTRGAPLPGSRGEDPTCLARYRNIYRPLYHHISRAVTGCYKALRGNATLPAHQRN